MESKRPRDLYEHSELCASCGLAATRKCFCCAPLCDDCEHVIHEDGTCNLRRLPPQGMKSHCRKTEQRYQPWYMRQGR